MEAALAQFQSDIAAEIFWRPFQLDPSLPKGRGKNKLEAYKEKFGADRIASMVPHMKQVGAEVGIDFSYGGCIGNTFDSHRFIWKARQTGGGDLQNKIVDAFFAAYFERERSLGDPTVLESCAKQAGMDSDTIDELLADESFGRAEVERERTEFRDKWNCTGVPLFIVDGKHPLSGAQPPEAFAKIFEDLLKK